MDRDNVGVVAVLEDLLGAGEGGKKKKGKGQERRRRKRLVVVANTHLLFNPRRGDVKLAQVEMLLRRLEVREIGNIRPPCCVFPALSSQR